MQIDPIKPKLKALGTQRLKLKSDEPLSDLAFKFNWHRYKEAPNTSDETALAAPVGRCRSTLSNPRPKRLELSARNQNMLNCFYICFNYTFNFNLSRYTTDTDEELAAAPPPPPPTTPATFGVGRCSLILSNPRNRLAAGTKRLKLGYDGPHSNFAFKCNLRRYIGARITTLFVLLSVAGYSAGADTRPLFGST